MTPGTRQTLIRLGAGIGFCLILLWFMRALESITTIVLVAFFMAYILDPLVGKLEAWRIPRPVAVLLVILSGAGVSVLALLFVIPSIIAEVASFVNAAPHYFEKLQVWTLATLESLDIELPRDWGQVQAYLMDKWKLYLPKMADVSTRVFASVFQSTLSFASALIHILMIPILAYYFMTSFESIKAGMADMIPPYARETVLEKLSQIDTVLAAFVRGQLTICSILAVLYSIGFLIVGIDLAIVLGLLGGGLFIIPYFGTAVALVGATGMALVKFGDLAHVLYVVAWITVVQLFESYVFTPRIVGDAVGLHPVVYILALLIGAKLFGFVGLLVAIPVAAILKVFLVTGVEMYRNSYLYKDAPSEKIIESR